MPSVAFYCETCQLAKVLIDEKGAYHAIKCACQPVSSSHRAQRIDQLAPPTMASTGMLNLLECDLLNILLQGAAQNMEILNKQAQAQATYLLTLLEIIEKEPDNKGLLALVDLKLDQRETVGA